jgi:RNA polymerase sigma factor (sigma-70 family)
MPETALTNEEAWEQALSIRYRLRYVALTYRGQGLEDEDLMQEALIGARLAVDRYDPKAKNSYWTFAQHRVRGHLSAAVIDSRLIRVTAHKLRTKLFNLMKEAALGYMNLGDLDDHIVCDRQDRLDEGLVDRVMAAIEDLDEPDRRVICGLFFEGKTLRVLVDELGVSVTQVWLMKNRSLDRLRSMCA